VFDEGDSTMSIGGNKLNIVECLIIDINEIKMKYNSKSQTSIYNS